MNELIKVKENPQGVQVVSARELYDRLNMNKAVFARWAQKNIKKNGFAIENQDWSMLNIMLSNGNTATDYALTLDFAKRLAMKAGTKEGEAVRTYFLECEKAVKQSAPSLPSPKELAMMVIRSEEAREAAEHRAAIAERSASHNQIKADYVDTVLTSENTWTTTVIAKELGMSATMLNRRLSGLGVQYKTGDGVWVLKAKYQGRGYTTTRTHIFVDGNGNTMSNIVTVWTEKGRAFIHWFLRE